jgi:hypothetical protein
MDYLKDLPKTRELHIVGADYDSGKGFRGWYRWLRGQQHPDQVERELEDQKEFFIQKLKDDKKRYAEVIKLAKVYKETAERGVVPQKTNTRASGKRGFHDNPSAVTPFNQ